GTIHPATVNVIPSRNATPAPPNPPRRKPKRRPPVAPQPLIARKVCGDIVMPAVISFSETASTDVFGERRSTADAIRPDIGATTRSPNVRVSPFRRTILPYVDARPTAARRRRAGPVATSATRNPAPARQPRARTRSITSASPLERHDLLEE